MTSRFRPDLAITPGLALFIAALAGCVPLDRYTTTRADARADRVEIDLATLVDGDASDLPPTPRCPEGFDRCARDVCTDLRASASHCGACNNVCALANATATCEVGACVVASCNPGFADCDNNPATGCETNTSTNLSRCGRCGNACPTAGGMPVCRDGVCRVATCAVGFADCDGSDANGCETETRTSSTHCGACGRACARPNAAARCEVGVCVLGVCEGGFGDCDGDAANGCETSTMTSTAHCGACGRACASTSGVATCVGGACALRCDAGSGDCDGSAANGCERNLLADAANCGTCGHVCAPGMSCSAGACATGCGVGEVSCSGECANLQTSATHCGGCGRACPTVRNGAATCAAGSCGRRCDAGFVDCNLDILDGCETRVLANPLNCGACRMMCPVPPGSIASCVAGACGSTCLAGQGDCDGNATNGCETSLLTSAGSCGVCGRACAAANATPVCRSGACAVGACNAGFADCNGTPADGCEVNTQGNVAHCGGCNRVCSLPNAVADCVGGACAVGGCNAGFANCDGNPGNGCEASIATSATHCGSCGNACVSGATCANGVCCGAPDLRCCQPGNTCNNIGGGSSRCALGQCTAPCGDRGQPCCAGLPRCVSMLMCNAATNRCE